MTRCRRSMKLSMKPEHLKDLTLYEENCFHAKTLSHDALLDAAHGSYDQVEIFLGRFVGELIILGGHRENEFGPQRAVRCPDKREEDAAGTETFAGDFAIFTFLLN